MTSSGVIAAGWPADGVAACTETNVQDVTALTADGTGGVILAWQDARDSFTGGWDIYAVRLTGAGTVAPGWPENGVAVCRARENQYYPELISDGTGGAIIAWEDYRDGDSFNRVGGRIYALRLDGGGQIAAGWVTDGTPVCTTTTSQYGPQVVADGAGGAIIAWNDGDVHAQRLTASGPAADGWPACGVTLCAARGSQWYAAICTDGAGGAFVTWEDLRTWFGIGSWFPYFDIYGSHVTASGMIAAGWPADGLAVCDARDGQFFHSIAADGAGGVVVAWTDYRDFDATTYALRLTGAGTLAQGWPLNGGPVSTTAGLQFDAIVAADASGGAYIAFEEFDPATSFQWVRVQHMTGDGRIAPGWDQAGARVAGSLEGQTGPTIVASGLGAIVSWDDTRNVRTGTGSDIYAQRFVEDGPVPVLVSLVEARAEPDRVLVTWHTADAAGLSATVERRTENSAWDAIATVVADASGMVRFEDRNVGPGQRYGYRLRLVSQAAQIVGGETWVEVPAAFTLTLEGPHPNPAQGAFVVAFSLPSGAPASIELFDAGGRRLSEREVGSSGPGRHAISLEETAAFPPGVYWMRLQQSGHAQTARAVKYR